MAIQNVDKCCVEGRGSEPVLFYSSSNFLYGKSISWILSHNGILSRILGKCFGFDYNGKKWGILGLEITHTSNAT